MKLRSLSLRTFRNHTATQLEPADGTNVFVGGNGQGKTSILEAISCLCLTKSLFVSSDDPLVQLDADRFEVEGLFISDAGTEKAVRLAVSSSGEKGIAINGIHLERLSSVIGTFPVVLLAPESGTITTGPPTERRRFLDVVLSQVSRTYLDDLLDYRQCLRQRNRVLMIARETGTLRSETIEPWDEKVAELGARIIRKRAEFVDDVLPRLLMVYQELVFSHELPGMRFTTPGGTGEQKDPSTIRHALLNEFVRLRDEELRRGLTLVGPHRDDLELQLNGMNLQRYASQGQHKSFLVALKCAEFLYLKEKKEETPVFLLDDVLSELDRQRAQNLIRFVANLGQSMITTTDDAAFDHPLLEDVTRFHVDRGTVHKSQLEHGQTTDHRRSAR